jgi:hypothetical protein
MTMTTETHWERIRALEFEIEDVDCERLSAPGGPGPAGEGDRITALLALHGGGHTGLTEEIGLMEPADYDTFAELARSLPLADSVVRGARAYAAVVRRAATVGADAQLPHVGVRVRGARSGATPGRRPRSRRCSA